MLYETKKNEQFYLTFWVLIRKMKREGKNSKLALKAFHNGDIPRKTKKKYRRKKEKKVNEANLCIEKSKP